MQSGLRREFERLMDELSQRDIEIGTDTRNQIERQFEDAEQAYLSDPHREAKLAENTDKIVGYLAQATAYRTEGGGRGGGGDGGPTEDAGTVDRDGGETVRYLTPSGVDSAFGVDCLWPWCP